MRVRHLQSISSDEFPSLKEEVLFGTILVFTDRGYVVAFGNYLDPEIYGGRISVFSDIDKRF